MDMRRLRPVVLETMQLAFMVGATVALLAVAAWFWTKRMSQSAKLATLLAICVILRALKPLLGTARRRSTHWLVQYGAWAAFYLPIPLASYALGIMNSSPSLNKSVILAWVFELTMTFIRHKGNMTSYSLNDTLQHGRRHAQRLITPLYWLFLTFNPFSGMQLYNEFCCAMGLPVPRLFVVVLTKFYCPVTANIISSYRSSRLAEYMKLEADSGEPFFDRNTGTTSLDNCRYPFEMRDDDSWVTIKDVTQRSRPDSVDRNICLSYTFFSMIKRRYYGFHCAEEGDQRARDFVLEELLADGTGGKRAFEVVEVQLAFLFDHFFTPYSSLIHRMPLGAGEDELPHLLVFGSLIAIMISVVLQQQDGIDRFLICLQLIDGVLMILQSMNTLGTDWYEVWYAFHCDRIRGRLYRPSALEKLAGWLRNKLFIRHQYWQNKIGQYSLLEDYDRVSVKKRVIAWLDRFTLDESLDIVALNPSSDFVTGHHPLEEDPVTLPDSVKKAVSCALRQTVQGSLTNGASSLQRNGVSDKFWRTCCQPTYTDTILIWHVATCYCEMMEDFSRSTPTDYEVAIKLSRYCAYLVAFLPELLPEHSLTTTIVFQRVVREANGLLGKTSSMEEKRTKIQELQLPPEEEGHLNTFEKGVLLGKQLVSLDDPQGTGQRWKVMAEFWAEAMLYVAPSDNVAEHIEQLAKGGQFVTHLWALLSNAGILKRAREEENPQQQQQQQQQPGAPGNE